MKSHVVITLPAAPAGQLLPQTNRAFAASGTLAPVPPDIDTACTSVEIDADLNGTVDVQVRERLSNGALSEPATFQFIPANLIRAKSADPAGFSAAVTSVTE